MSEISLVYEAIGRLVVAFVSRRYRGEVRLASTAVALGLIAAILWLFLGRRFAQDVAGGRASGVGSRKSRSGQKLSIR